MSFHISSWFRKAKEQSLQPLITVDILFQLKSKIQSSSSYYQKLSLNSGHLTNHPKLQSILLRDGTLWGAVCKATQYKILHHFFG